MKKIIYTLISSILICGTLSFVYMEKNKYLETTNNISNMQSTFEILTNKKWKNCKTVISGIVTNYNICKTVCFFSDLKGVIELPSGDKEYFEWSYSDSLIIISNIYTLNISTFSNGKYKVEYKEKLNYFDVKLQGFNQDIIYFLGSEN